MTVWDDVAHRQAALKRKGRQYGLLVDAGWLSSQEKIKIWRWFWLASRYAEVDPGGKIRMMIISIDVLINLKKVKIKHLISITQKVMTAHPASI